MINIKEEIEQLRLQSNLRIIPNVDKKIGKNIYIDGQPMINFSSNDYLGLGNNKLLVDEFLETKGNDFQFLFSSTSARLLSGTSRIYNQLEQNLAKMFGKDSALLFNTGYQCNLGVVSSIVKRGDVVFCDKLNHASIIDGIKLSGADFYRYKHLDYDNLEYLLQKNRNNYKRAIIISESVFSMDGDIADIQKLIELKKRYNSLLFVDEAHAFGIWGGNLSGISQLGNYVNDIDIISATLGKSFASMGAFVVANSELITYITNKARSFIFSTALPPVNILWSNWLLEEKLELLKLQSNKLQDLIKKTHDYLLSSDIKTPSSTQIVPIVIGDNEKTVVIAEKLQALGNFVLPIRPPTVAPNSSRLRLSLCANMEFEDVKKVIDMVKNEI